jgi:hypothetical protein
MPTYEAQATIIVRYEIEAPSRAVARDLLDGSFIETDMALTSEGEAVVESAEMDLEAVTWTDGEEDEEGDSCAYCGRMVPEHEGRERTASGRVQVAHEDCAVRLGWVDQDDDA